MQPHEHDRVRANLDLQEGRGPVPILDDATIAEVLLAARRIAVIGASDRPDRPSPEVLAELVRAGHEAVPVTPAWPTVLGRAAYPDLGSAVAATGPFDIVDVFRRPELCAAHAGEAVPPGRGSCGSSSGS